MKKHYLNILLNSIMAGVSIGIGVLIYVSLLNTNKIVGSLFFGLGLFLVINWSFWLYTGKVGFVLDNKPKYLIDLVVCILGNFIGIIAICSLMRLTRFSPTLIENAKTIVEAKDNDSWYSLLLLSFMCGIMIYIAVKGHKDCPYNIGKVVIVFLAISIFILCGFEHSIANAGYYALAGIFRAKSILNFLIVILGNALGSIFFDGMLKLINKTRN